MSPARINKLTLLVNNPLHLIESALESVQQLIHEIRQFVRRGELLVCECF